MTEASSTASGVLELVNPFASVIVTAVNGFVYKKEIMGCEKDSTDISRVVAT
jgi:hypothetical protein